MRTFLVVLLCGLPFLIQAQTVSETQRIQQFNLQHRWAIEMYDPVAHFEGKPLKGDPNISLLYKGVKYAFSSREHFLQFKTTPSKYEPQYGGWCAYAMGNSGEKVSVDPETYKIVGDRLYLFYHSWVNNTLNKWNKDEKRLKTNADRNWANYCK